MNPQVSLSWLRLGGAALLVVGCAASAQVPAPRAPAAPDTAPVAEEPAAARSLPNLGLLCPPTATPGAGLTLDNVSTQLKTDDGDVRTRSQRLLNAAEGECPDAADKLHEAFELQKGTSRSFCDLYQQRGVGSGGDALLKRTEAELLAVDKDFAAAKDKKACVAGRVALAEKIADWRHSLRECTPSAEQRAAMDCGKSAPGVCQALQAGAAAAPDEQAKLTACLAAIPRDGQPRGLDDAGERGLESVAGPGLETTLLQGTAEFFEARAKKEAQLFAYEVVTAQLCNDEHVLPLLENTCALFAADDELAATPATIQQAVRADFGNLPEKLIPQIADANLKCGAALAWTFSKEAVEGTDVLELLSHLEVLLTGPLVQEPSCSKANRERLATLAAELKKRLEKDRPTRERLVKAGQFEAAVLLNPGQRGLLDPLTKDEEIFKKVMMRVSLLDVAHQAWSKDPNGSLRAEVVLAGLRTIEPLLAGVFRNPAVAKTVDLAIQLSAQLINRDYSAAVVTSAELASSAGLKQGNARNLLGLAAGLAQAKSSDEVRETIEDAALPLGSWRRKTQKRFGATLTGLVGLQFTREIAVERTASGGDVSSGSALAPTLIVGADLHRGLGGIARVGLQVSALDLGALLSFRMDKATVNNQALAETADPQPEVRFVQVLSPGFYPYIGLGPFDLGAGVSYVPALRSVSGGGKTEALDVVRFGGFVAMDVSVLPLW